MENLIDKAKDSSSSSSSNSVHSHDDQNHSSSHSSSSSSFSNPDGINPESPSNPLSQPVPSDLASNSDSSSSDLEETSTSTSNQSRRRTIQDKLSSLSQYGIEISVSNPQIKHSSFSKHVLYTVSGSDSLGGFQVLRRYKEFLALRKILMIEWPGCCILSLPPKQAIVKFI